MAIKSVLVVRFFQLVTNRQFAEAERELQRLQQKIQKTEWNRGYYRALYGILLATKNNNDNYVFLSSLNLNDKNAIQQYRKEFLQHVKNRFHGDYDRGFFSAWADYMRILSKMEINNPKDTAGNQSQKVEAQT
jgi:viroplasmin and RNaseH domain-containing protein